MDFEQTIRQLQDTTSVMAGIQERQARLLKSHSEWLEENERFLTRMREGQELHEQRLAVHDRMMAEMNEKLNALIQIVGSLIKRNGRQ